MFVEDKFFNQDKNYLMKTVQAFSKEMLLDSWLAEVIKSYNILHNPMGLEDDFYIHLKRSIQLAKPLISDNYDILAAIYRLNHTDNQLEFMWDGRSHMEKYDEEWKSTFADWIEKITLIKEIQRPIIKYATQNQSVNTTFLTQGIRRAIVKYFRVKLRTRKGQLLLSA